MPLTLKLRTLTPARPLFQQTRPITHSTKMSANEYGQGKSHATGDSAVPGKVQEVAPKGVEEALPDEVCLLSWSNPLSFGIDELEQLAWSEHAF